MADGRYAAALGSYRAGARVLERGLGHLGMAALAGIYLAVIGYGVWVGGDFVDWRRVAEEGHLDRVAGVVGTVRAATGAAAA